MRLLVQHPDINEKEKEVKRKRDVVNVPDSCLEEGRRKEGREGGRYEGRKAGRKERPSTAAGANGKVSVIQMNHVQQKRRWLGVCIRALEVVQESRGVAVENDSGEVHCSDIEKYCR